MPDIENDDDAPEFIDSPDELDDDPELNGLTCFLNSDRVCGPDCMSYSTFASESPMLNDEQKHCTLLVAAERLGRYSGIIIKTLRNEQQDRARSSEESPVKPSGPLAGGRG